MKESIEWLTTYGISLFIVLFCVAALVYSVVYDNNINKTINKTKEHSDGVNTDGFICYNKRGVDVQRQAYIMVHELCHDIVEKEKEDFCK